MDPVTINLEGLAELMQFGPLGYVIALAMATAMCGMISWRQITAAGRCHGCNCEGNGAARTKMQMQGNSHTANAIVSGVVAVMQLIFVLVMTYELFAKSLAGMSQ